MIATKTFAEPALAAGAGTPPIAFNHRSGKVALQIVVSGTINFDVQSTNSDIQGGATPQWFADSSASQNISANIWLTFNAVPAFIRVYTNSITPGATVTINWTQEDV